MLIESQFIRGAGSLHVNKAGFNDEWSPALFGLVTLDFADHWGNRRISPKITAKVIGGNSRYELIIGPMKGRLIENPAKFHDADFDFFGWVGSLDEICVKGWKRTSDSGERHIWLEFHPVACEDQGSSKEIGDEVIFEF